MSLEQAQAVLLGEHRRREAKGEPAGGRTSAGSPCRISRSQSAWRPVRSSAWGTAKERPRRAEPFEVTGLWPPST